MKQLRVIITVHSYDDIESPSAPLTPHPPNTYYQDYIQLFININVSQNFQYSIQVFLILFSYLYYANLPSQRGCCIVNTKTVD